MNHAIFLNLYSLAHQSVLLDGLYIFCAKYLPYLVIVLAIVFLFFHHEIITSKNPFVRLSQKWREIVLVFFSSISAWGVATLIKIIVQAPRPYLVFPQIVPLLNKIDFSFPSGHATFFMALATALFFSHKKVGYLFGLVAFLIGLTRIITGVHFPIDILGGYILGILVACLVNFLYKKIYKRG